MASDPNNAFARILRGEIPARKVAVGNPARIVKDVSDEMLKWKTEGTALYQALPAQLHGSLREAEPLREVPPGRAEQKTGYETWGKRSDKSDS